MVLHKTITSKTAFSDWIKRKVYFLLRLSLIFISTVLISIVTFIKAGITTNLNVVFLQFNARTKFKFMFVVNNHWDDPPTVVRVTQISCREGNCTSFWKKTILSENCLKCDGWCMTSQKTNWLFITWIKEQEKMTSKNLKSIWLTFHSDACYRLRKKYGVVGCHKHIIFVNL